MMPTRRLFSLGLLALAAVPAGCTSPNPDLFTLDALPGTVRTGGPRVVIVQDIGLAPYLDRKAIVRSAAGYHIEVETNDWWGETLSAMIGRVLVTELGERLPASLVFAESSTVSPHPDATVAINITRFDKDERGALILVAEVEVSYTATTRPPAVSTLRFTAQPSAPKVDGQVQAMSAALAQLADAIARILSP